MFANSLALVKECDLTWLHVFPYSPRQGTPAARMPLVNREVIKKRASALRQVGAQQVARHLSAQQGQAHRILMENPHMGRTEQFAEVRFTAPQPESQIVNATITGVSNNQLTA